LTSATPSRFYSSSEEFSVCPSPSYDPCILTSILQEYVQVKPFLAIASLALKASGKYNEGEFRADSGYLYVSIIYNVSICLSLYCLAMFWLSINEDLRLFRSVVKSLLFNVSNKYACRPMPKFLCVKGILFFSFWQAIGISLLASVGAIKKLGPYTDKEHISLGLTDTLICLEMPFFAIAHLSAFSHRDYIDKKLAYVGRMPVRQAFRDAFGIKDVLEDVRATLNGRGMDYREFEPSEGHMHQGLGRERRIRAGLRYSHGGRGKYWLPQTAMSNRGERLPEDVVHAPLLSGDAEDTIQDIRNTADDELVAVGFDLPFGGLDSEDEELFANSRKYLFGDYNYPCIDASSEIVRAEMWEEEERILSNERSAWFSDRHGRNAIVATNYGALSVSQPQQSRSHSSVSAIDPEYTRESADDHSDAQPRRANIYKPKFGLKSAQRPSDSRPSSISAAIDSAGPAGRPDAIDLVTEDTHIPVPETDNIQGELVSRGATRKAYQLEGNAVLEEGGKREKRNNPHGTRRDAEGSEDKAIVGVTQVEPPLSHRWTRGLVNVYDDLDSDENPWV
jgi:hypothetical protein